jgi:beta-xylosidase
MFYGAHNTESGACQICLATSRDGRTFQRYKDSRGYSRIFVGPGEARDPMVIRVGNEWVCYYTGFDPGKRRPCKVYARTSDDLIHWSDYREVAWGGFASGTGLWSAECPFVIHRDGLYYLFRTSEYRSPARTHVYCSSDPFDFGLGNDSKWVTTLRVAAPEVVQVGNQTYISSVEDLGGGIQLFKLKWV